jgi:hypothetical protein
VDDDKKGCSDKKAFASYKCWNDAKFAKPDTNPVCKCNSKTTECGPKIMCHGVKAVAEKKH